jgi:hypothetical protein
MVLQGTGIDIIECMRFERLLQKQSFVHGVFTEQELSYIMAKNRLESPERGRYFLRQGSADEGLRRRACERENERN